MDGEIRQILSLILNKVSNIEQDISGIKEDQISMRQDISGIKEEQAIMKKRQDEMFEVLKAIEHSNNARKAEIDGLNHKAAYVEGTINGIGEFIQKRKAQ